MSEKCSVCGKGGTLQTVEARVESAGAPLLKIKLCDEHKVQFDTKAVSLGFDTEGLSSVEEVDE